MTSNEHGNKRMMFWIVVAASILVPLALVAWKVDDWSRDFTTNTAVTSAEATDPNMRPVDTTADAAEVADAITTWVSLQSAWHLEQPGKLPPQEADLHEFAKTDAASGGMHLVRTTAVFRFKDDIWVVLERLDDGTRIHIESRSRVGKGDLGQNPRNVRELRTAIADGLRPIDE